MLDPLEMVHLIVALLLTVLLLSVLKLAGKL
jgi:hypothetical protein